MKVKNTLTTIDGTLYENDIVFVEGTEKNGDLRVKDSMGRIWFLKVMNDVTEFILGKEESLLDKKKRTMGFVADAVKPKRKYTRRKKKNATKKQK